MQGLLDELHAGRSLVEVELVVVGRLRWRHKQEVFEVPELLILRAAGGATGGGRPVVSAVGGGNPSCPQQKQALPLHARH